MPGSSSALSCAPVSRPASGFAVVAVADGVAEDVTAGGTADVEAEVQAARPSGSNAAASRMAAGGRGRMDA